MQFYTTAQVHAHPGVNLNVKFFLCISHTSLHSPPTTSKVLLMNLMKAGLVNFSKYKRDCLNSDGLFE